MTVSNRVFIFSAIVLLVGCRTSARIKDIPRVDLELNGAGNRGYLLGTAPESTNLKTTRQILETDIEIPSYYKPKPRSGISAGQVEGSESNGQQGTIAVGGSSQEAETGPMDTYVVRKGDTLSGIAAKPEIYGKATKWNRLLKANYDLLKGNPKYLRAGMTLKVPRGSIAEAGTASGGEEGGTTFRK